MGRNLVETVMGAVVLLIAGFFLIFAYNSSDLRPVSGYEVMARQQRRLGGAWGMGVGTLSMFMSSFSITLLALLVANAGRPMSTEALIDGAYGDGAPDGARRSVQTYISTLRSLFGDMIRSVPSGYEFRPIDSWIDAALSSSS